MKIIVSFFIHEMTGLLRQERRGGVVLTRGRRRVPKPPTRMRARNKSQTESPDKSSSLKKCTLHDCAWADINPGSVSTSDEDGAAMRAGC
jgi:hypothetical protein